MPGVADNTPMHAGRVVLYLKPGCHLCDDLHDQLRAALRGSGVVVTERNIAADLDDYERYKHAIPVLVIDGREVARHRIDDDGLRAALEAAGLAGAAGGRGPGSGGNG